MHTLFPDARGVYQLNNNFCNQYLLPHHTCTGSGRISFRDGSGGGVLPLPNVSSADVTETILCRDRIFWD